MNNLHIIVRDQFPDFVREDYPLFVSFVEAYYKWLDEQSAGKIEAVADLDTTPEQFVEYFKRQLDAFGIFNSVEPFNPLYLQRIKDIYNSKGSEQALVNILRLTKNAETQISYPGEYVLRASDGKWYQESFIVVEQVYGSLPESVLECFVRYGETDVRLEISRLEQISTTETRIYFKLRYNFVVTQNQLVFVYGENNDVLYAGKILRIPVSLSIINGGKNWQLGQVIVLPGTVSDTVARVSEVTAQGEILAVDILQYGYAHSENQTFIVSPYPNKPVGTTYDITTTQTSVNPVKYQHTLSLNDYVDGVTDIVQGVATGVMSSSYFLQNYVQSSYVGGVVFENVTTEVGIEEDINTSITLEQWLESRATVTYQFGTTVTQRGRWLDESSIISNESIKLQDNLYYQQFSYDIQSDASPESYIEIARSLNPAGSKLFTTYNLSETLEIVPTGITSFPFLKIDLLDVSTVEDNRDKLIVKSPSDSLSTTDFDKQIITKKPTESITINEVDKQYLTKKRLDDITSYDENSIELSKSFIESLTSSDVSALTIDKYLTDSASISSSDNSVYELVQYNDEEYFGEPYVIIEKYLTIGD